MAPRMAQLESHVVTLRAADGVPVTGRAYEPADGAEMTVLMLPGIAVPQRVFRYIAGWLSLRGARCLTVDYRGIGESRAQPAATKTPSLLNWARLDAVAALLELFESADVVRRDIAPSNLGVEKIGHVGLFRPGPTQRVWLEIHEFCRRQLNGSGPAGPGPRRRCAARSERVRSERWGV